MLPQAVGAQASPFVTAVCTAPHGFHSLLLHLQKPLAHPLAPQGKQRVCGGAARRPAPAASSLAAAYSSPSDCSRRSLTSSVLSAMMDSSTAAEKAASVSYSCARRRQCWDRAARV